MDALSPENPLIVGVGPLCGTLAPASGRFTVTAKSPLTDVHGDSNVGGFFGPELRYAGYSQLVVSGRSDKPVYLWIDDGEVEIRDARDLKGRSTWETQDLIDEELGDPAVKTICIGPAGENLVRYASMISGLSSAAGRTGMGAVMGSKNLKAVSVRGSRGIEVNQPVDFSIMGWISIDVNQLFTRWDDKYRRFSSHMDMGDAGREKHARVKGLYFVVCRKEHISFNNVFTDHPDILPKICWRD